MRISQGSGAPWSRRDISTPVLPRAPGFQYRRWALGERLPGPYFARSFWIGDFGIYGLFAPPYGYVWVRYGPDAVLIDEYYRRSHLSMVYGVFID